jgi:hypothetical protein
LDSPPWVWIRRRLAEKWHITPWAVDLVSHREILLELRLSALEQEGEAFRKQRGS